MIRFDNDREVVSETPEDKALLLFAESGSYDFLFEFDLSLFRCKINEGKTGKILNGRIFPLENSPNELSKIRKLLKVKHISYSVPNILEIYPKKIGSESNFFYLIKVYSKNNPAGISIEMSGSEIASHCSFSRIIAKKVTFGFFEGSIEDYQFLRKKMIDHCHKYGRIINSLRELET